MGIETLGFSGIYPAADWGLRFYNVDNAAEKDDVDVISQLNAVFGRSRISISACV